MTWSTHDPWEHPGLSVDTATDARRGVEGRPSLEQTVKRATVTLPRIQCSIGSCMDKCWGFCQTVWVKNKKSKRRYYESNLTIPPDLGLQGIETGRKKESLLHLSGSLCLIHESHHWNRLPARTMNVKPVNKNLYLISCFCFTFIPTNILLLVLIALFL